MLSQTSTRICPHHIEELSVFYCFVLHQHDLIFDFVLSFQIFIHQRSGSTKVSLLVCPEYFHGSNIILEFADIICLCTDILKTGVCVHVCVCDVQVGKMDLWTGNTVHWIYQNVQNK